MNSSFLSLVVIVMSFLPFGNSRVTIDEPGVGKPCPVSYKPMGCFKDKVNDRALPQLIMTDRDESSRVTSHKKILWKNFPIYLESLACRCAMKTKERGYSAFGLQYYGECHSGEDAEFDFDRHGETTACVNGQYGECGYSDKALCVGKANANFVYELIDTEPASGEEIRGL